MISTAVLLVLLAASRAGPGSPADPCERLRVPLPPRLERVADDTRRELEAYRSAWRAVCDPKGDPVDLEVLFGDAEALGADVALSGALDAIATAVADGEGWPLPGIRYGPAGSSRVDWASFVQVAGRGTAEDQRFWHAAALATDDAGEPAWLAGAGAARCVRLTDARWSDLDAALGQMETAGSARYARHARALRARLTDTLAEVGRGTVCGCVRGDAAAALQPLAAAAGQERLGTPARRALTKAAAEAWEALRTGRARVRWLRDAPGAPPTGCGPGSP